jgi:exopolysaccharide biosynthesis WecB/TagA/CpsF family protein
MTGVQDRVHRHRLNSLDLVTPDGQPVRWALNIAHRAGLKERVYGPSLMLRVCQEAASQGLGVYLYGRRQEVINKLVSSLKRRFPNLQLVGAEPSIFGTLSHHDRSALLDRIRQSQANILFVGLGCPRQEVFVYEVREALNFPVVAVGAAFDYHSGILAEPPLWMQRAGLQWFHRLAQEPGRLWKRYLLHNLAFLVRFFLQLTGLKCPDPTDTDHPLRPLFHG